MKATIRNAIPAKNRLPVRNQTTKATIAAGKINNSTSAINIIITIPIRRRMSNNATSNNPLGKAGILIAGKNIPLNQL